MELKVKITITRSSSSEWQSKIISDLVKVIQEIEKEYSCNCTLLEVEID